MYLQIRNKIGLDLEFHIPIAVTLVLCDFALNISVAIVLMILLFSNWTLIDWQLGFMILLLKLRKISVSSLIVLSRTCNLRNSL